MPCSHITTVTVLRDTIYAACVLLCSRSVTVQQSGSYKNKKTNSVARVRQRTIPTERQPLVGKVSGNFCG
jgi:hypothetical protein